MARVLGDPDVVLPLQLPDGPLPMISLPAVLLRTLRSVLALEGFAISLRMLRRTRQLEAQKTARYHDVTSAVALSRQGYLFGIPNSQVAMTYFLALGLVSISGLGRRRLVRPLVLLSAWSSLAVSCYLVYSLVFVLKRRCNVCMEGHLLNLALTLALTVRGSDELSIPPSS